MRFCKFITGLDVIRYVLLWYIGTCLARLKSYHHFFLADYCHTAMPCRPLNSYFGPDWPLLFTLQCTKFGQLIVRKIIKTVTSRRRRGRGRGGKEKGHSGTSFPPFWVLI